MRAPQQRAVLDELEIVRNQILLHLFVLWVVDGFSLLSCLVLCSAVAVNSGARYIVSTPCATWCIRNSIQFKLFFWTLFDSKLASCVIIIAHNFILPDFFSFDLFLFFWWFFSSPLHSIGTKNFMTAPWTESVSLCFWVYFIKTSNCINFPPTRSLQCFALSL